MSNKDNGGPAYPSRAGMMFYVPEEHKQHIQETIEAMDREHEGMTLRDYFAAKAMQGMLANTLADGSHIKEEDTPSICKMSYIIADNMIKERKN